ncbi:hypothetical protein DSO57_1004372 [Entomophthora muscae]|uniref:Uncharacterized protein n=1 Tax=Entomophthora muscae TaxID=34485 RepID=A0ACC2U7D3_9FUNG|nr:hypothetical protein DSO57_1004372 [Entomophthora muscae]
MQLLKLICLVRLAQAELAGVYGGGCDILGSTIVYAGGFTSTDGLNLNNKIYSLDLSLGVEIDKDGKAPWAVSESEGIKAIYPSVAAVNSTKLVVFGSSSSRNRTTLWTLSEGKLRADRRISTFWSENMIGSLVGTYSAIAGSLARGEDNELVYYGGLLGASPNYTSTANILALVYSSNHGTWREISSSGPPAYDHASVIYKGRMLVIGGVNPLSDQLRPLSSIPTLDLTTGIWVLLNATGDIPDPRMGHSQYRSGSTLYMTGGSSGLAEGATVDDAIFRLELDTLTWSRMVVPGFVAGYRGCLVMHRSLLFYSFGERDGPRSTTRIINPMDQSLVSTLSSVNPNSPAIVASILGISVGLIFLLTIILFLRQRQTTHLDREATCVQPDDIFADPKGEFLKSESDYPPPM